MIRPSSVSFILTGFYNFQYVAQYVQGGVKEIGEKLTGWAVLILHFILKQDARLLEFT